MTFRRLEIIKTLIVQGQAKCGISKEMDKQHIAELKRLIREKKATEAVEKVLAKFCTRHGVSLNACRIYYRRLVEKGEIKEK